MQKNGNVFKFEMKTLADFWGKILTFIDSIGIQHITEELCFRFCVQCYACHGEQKRQA